MLKALAHPLRGRIMDLLSVHGASTVSGLARRADVAVGSISHHLGVLADAGLVVEVPELAATKREHWWDRAGGGIAWNTEEMEDAEGQRTAAALELAGLEEQAARTRAWIERRDPAENPLDAASFVHRAWLWLSPEEMAALREDVIALVATYKGLDPEGREPVLFAGQAFPEEP